MKPSTLTQLLVALICNATTARNETDTLLSQSQQAENFVAATDNNIESPTPLPTTAAPTPLPTPLPTTALPTAEPTQKRKPFRLRLTWKNGYRWQEKSSERYWCMRCKSLSCSKGSGIELDNCSKNDSRQQFYFDDKRIRSSKSGHCLERRGRSIKLDTCGSSQNQKWDGLSVKQPFQLREAGSTVKCASQHHEPRDGEILYMTSCKKSRASKTDLWNVY